MMKLDDYLARIAYAGVREPNATTLAALQRAHLFAVPFENLSIGWGEPIVLDVAQHYEKIVDRKRGGFCYEQNSLFAWALVELGFSVNRLAAGVWSPDRPGDGFGDEFGHMALRVALDEAWLADVGFGDNFRAPLRLTEDIEQLEGARAFRLTRDGERLVMEMREADGVWQKRYRFALIARPIEAFAAMCRFHQTSKLSPFTQKRVCSLATESGRITLSGDEWIATRRDGTRCVTLIAGEAEAERLLLQHFGIETPTTWPKCT